MPVDQLALRALAARQCQAVSRAQVLGLGATPSWLSRQVATARWLRILPGVYVVHTGEPSWLTRAVAALLYAGPGAALSHDAAGFRHAVLVRAPRTIEVSVDHRRRVRPQPALVIHRRRTMPPSGGAIRSVDRPHTVLDLVERAGSTDDVVGLVCAAARARVDPREVLAALATRPATSRGGLLRELLADVEAGIESPLELRYHRDVERRHALPSAALQLRERLPGGWIRADARYLGLGVRTELDGALAHPGGRTDADTWRDNAVLLATREITLRYRWRHVAVTPCETAAQVATALRVGGWAGSPLPCRPGCAVERMGNI